MSLTVTVPPTGDPWHRVDVCNSSVLARTQVSLIGVLDGRALETIEEAVDLAEDNGHMITLDLGEMCSITPDALTTLLTRSHPPYDGPLGLLSSRPRQPVALRTGSEAAQGAGSQRALLPPGQMKWRTAR